MLELKIREEDSVQVRTSGKDLAQVRTRGKGRAQVSTRGKDRTKVRTRRKDREQVRTRRKERIIDRIIGQGGYRHRQIIYVCLAAGNHSNLLKRKCKEVKEIVKVMKLDISEHQ